MCDNAVQRPEPFASHGTDAQNQLVRLSRSQDRHLERESVQVETLSFEELRIQASALALQACLLSTHLDDLAQAQSESLTTRSLEQPAFVKSLEPLPQPELSALCNLSEDAGTFTLGFLSRTLGGIQWTPGFNYPTSSTILAAQGWYVVDADFDPFVPVRPGQHGAKLVAFFNTNGNKDCMASETSSSPSQSAFNNAPLFVGRLNESGEKAYVYLGQYSQPRLSDRLDFEHQLDVVPNTVKLYWAEQLSDQMRPMWVTRALMEHLFPRPVYRGPTRNLYQKSLCRGRPVPLSKRTEKVGSGEELRDSWRQYLAELSEWEEEAHGKVNRLKPEDIMRAFDEPDSAQMPGLRLWWEYLECVGSDSEFVHRLVAARDGELAASNAVIKYKLPVQHDHKQRKNTRTTVKAWLWGVAEADGSSSKKQWAKDKPLYVPPPLRHTNKDKDGRGVKSHPARQALEGVARDHGSGEYVPLHIRLAGQSAKSGQGDTSQQAVGGTW